MNVGMLAKVLEAEEREQEERFVIASYIGDSIGNLIRILTKSDYPHLFDVYQKVCGRKDAANAIAADDARTNALNMLAKFRRKGGDHDGDNVV